MAKRRMVPKTPFGVRVAEFRARYAMTYEELAKAAGVKQSTLEETAVGRTRGEKLIPIVDAYMEAYERGERNESIHDGE